MNRDTITSNGKSTSDQIAYVDDIKTSNDSEEIPKLIIELDRIMEMKEIFEDGHRLINWEAGGESILIWDFDYLAAFHFGGIDPKNFRHRLNRHKLTVKSYKKGSKSFILRHKEGLWCRDNRADWNKISYECPSKKSGKQVQVMMAEKDNQILSLTKERDFYKNRCAELENTPIFGSRKRHRFGSPKRPADLLDELTDLHENLSKECERIESAESDGNFNNFWQETEPVSSSEFCLIPSPSASPSYQYTKDNKFDAQERKIRDSFAAKKPKQ